MLKPYCFCARSARLDEQLVGCHERRAAVFAHEVAMGAGGQVVGGGTVPEVGMDDDPEPFEFLEIAVDGRQMHVGRPFLDDRGEVLRAVVTGVVEDGLEEQAP